MAVPSFNIAPGESSDAAAQRRRLATALMMQGADASPIQHWTQGAARVAQSIIGGMELNREDQKEEAKKAAGRDLYKKFIPLLMGDGQAASVPSPAAPTRKASEPLWSNPGTNGATVQDVNGQRVLSYQDTPGEGPSTVPSPLDPPDPKAMRLAAALVQAEAGNQGPVGQQSVANVLRNRAAESGMSVPQVVNQPGQFEPVMKGRMGQYGPGTPGYDGAVAAVERAYTGNDPTAGAVNFYAPKAQAQLAAKDGRPPVAKFDNGAGIDIQDQRYFTRATGGESPGIDAASAQSRVPHQAAPQRGGIAATLPGLLDNPYTAPLAQSIIQNQLQQRFAAPSYDFKVAGDTLYRVNPKTGAAERAGEASKGQFTKIGTDPATGEDIMGFVDPGSGRVTPYRPGQGQPPAQPAPSGQGQPTPVAIPPAPPGANPKAWRDQFTKEAAEKASGAPQAKARSAEAIRNLSKTGLEALRLSSHPGLSSATGPIQGRLPTLRDDPANFEADISTLGTKLFINTINQMRELSKTGGAVGSVTEKEMFKLENAQRSLSLTQGDKNMVGNLTKLVDDINDSMKSISEAYKQQYGEDLPFTPITVPDIAKGAAPKTDGWQDVGGGVRIREKR